MPKRVWKPKKKKRIRKHGFMKRMQSLTGRALLKRRRAKGRKSLSVTLRHTHAG